jgi:hypothetical protein
VQAGAFHKGVSSVTKNAYEQMADDLKSVAYTPFRMEIPAAIPNPTNPVYTQPGFNRVEQASMTREGQSK